MKVTLKHLARELNVDPFKLRQVLRTLYGKAKGSRWTWPSMEDKKYQAVKKKVQSHLTSKKAAPTNTTHPASGP